MRAEAIAPRDRRAVVSHIALGQRPGLLGGRAASRNGLWCLQASSCKGKGATWSDTHSKHGRKPRISQSYGSTEKRVKDDCSLPDTIGAPMHAHATRSVTKAQITTSKHEKPRLWLQWYTGSSRSNATLVERIYTEWRASPSRSFRRSQLLLFEKVWVPYTTRNLACESAQTVILRACNYRSARVPRGSKRPAIGSHLQIPLSKTIDFTCNLFGLVAAEVLLHVSLRQGMPQQVMAATPVSHCRSRTVKEFPSMLRCRSMVEKYCTPASGGATPESLILQVPDRADQLWKTGVMVVKSYRMTMKADQ